MTLFGKKGLCRYDQVEISRWGLPILPGWALNLITSVFIRDTEGETETPRGEGHVASEAEVGVMPWAAGARRGEEGSFPGGFRGTQP